MFGLITGLIFLTIKYSKFISVFLLSILTTLIPNLYSILINETTENKFLSNLFEVEILATRFSGRESSLLNKLNALVWAINNTPYYGFGVLDLSKVNEYFNSPDIVVNTAGSIFSLYIQYGKLFFVPYLITLFFIIY